MREILLKSEFNKKAKTIYININNSHLVFNIIYYFSFSHTSPVPDFYNSFSN